MNFKPQVRMKVLTFKPKKNAGVSQIQKLIQRDGLKCHWCKRTCDPSLNPSADLYPTREHVIRRADGGSSRMSNLVIACRYCNNGRHAKNFKTPKKINL
jgi:5-methylcytosine-specific restriction endonuclease McrA